LVADDLFTYSPPAARSYQETSREALQKSKRHKGDLDLAIMRAIAANAAAGGDGIICEAIEIFVGKKHQAVSGNLRHLVEDGFVKFTGRHGKTSSNRKAMKWALTEDGRRALAENKECVA
jgi:DNA-binding PadR family transcriptional regulator